LNKKDVFVVTKPLQYVNVLNIISESQRVILVVDTFINSKDFFSKIENNSSYWSQFFYFETMAHLFRWLIKNKKQFNTLFIDSDLNYRTEFFKLKKLNITVYEEGLGMYRKRQVLPRRKFIGGIYLKLLSLIGYKNKRGGGKYTRNIIAYYPSFYKSYHNENTKKIFSFKKPFLEHLEQCANINVFSHNIDLKPYRDKTVLLYISSWEIDEEELNYIKSINCDIKILKPHPHIKKGVVNYFFDLVFPGQIPVEFLIYKLIKLSKKLIIVSKYSTSTIYFHNYSNVEIINLDIKPIPYNDIESYLDSYYRLTEHIKNS
jgi:hypothetical protein